MERLNQYRLWLKSSEAKQTKQPVLLRKLTPACWQITFNKPEQYNVLSSDIVQKMDGFLSQIQQTPSKVVIFSGAGQKCFSAGGNLKQILANNTIQEKVLESSISRDLTQKYVQLTVPIVAIWKGIVMGAAVGITFNATVRIATETTLLALPQTRVGFYPNIGGAYLLTRLLDNPAFGLYLGLTSKVISGKETLQFGLATHYLENKELKWFYSQLLKRSEPGMSQAEIKEIVDQLLPPVQEATMDKTTREEILSIFKFDSMENIAERARTRAAEGSSLAEQCILAFERVSPFALKLTFELMKRSQHLTYQEEKELDLKILKKVLDPQVGDLNEGVKAMIVEKRKPNWRYKSIKEVPDYEIRKVFD